MMRGKPDYGFVIAVTVLPSAHGSQNQMYVQRVSEEKTIVIVQQQKCLNSLIDVLLDFESNADFALKLVAYPKNETDPVITDSPSCHSKPKKDILVAIFHAFTIKGY